jgi:hypothetical protein
MFEAIIFLKVNDRFWEVDDVVTTDNMHWA